MNDYLQPDFYRFNQDSLQLVNWIVHLNPQCTRLLDLGAGSGIIGIEVANRLKAAEVTFLEVQHDFVPYLEQNIAGQLKVSARTEIIECSFGEWKPQTLYDLIVCNPPYYLKGHGEVSSDSRKQTARSFERDNWTVLLKLIHASLTPQGRAFIVIKNDQRILNEVKSALNELELKVHEVEKLLILELSRLNID